MQKFPKWQEYEIKILRKYATSLTAEDIGLLIGRTLSAEPASFISACKSVAIAITMQSTPKKTLSLPDSFTPLVFVHVTLLRNSVSNQFPSEITFTNSPLAACQRS